MVPSVFQDCGTFHANRLEPCTCICSAITLWAGMWATIEQRLQSRTEHTGRPAEELLR